MSDPSVTGVSKEGGSGLERMCQRPPVHEPRQRPQKRPNPATPWPSSRWDSEKYDSAVRASRPWHFAVVALANYPGTGLGTLDVRSDRHGDRLDARHRREATLC